VAAVPESGYKIDQTSVSFEEDRKQQTRDTRNDVEDPFSVQTPVKLGTYNVSLSVRSLLLSQTFSGINPGDTSTSACCRCFYYWYEIGMDQEGNHRHSRFV